MQHATPVINDSVSGRASTSLSDKTFALDATQAEASIASLQEQVSELTAKIDVSRVEFSTFADRAVQYDRDADGIENGMAAVMRDGGNVDKAALQAATARSKAHAARQTAENVKNDIARLESNLQIRQTALGAAVQNRAGILFKARAQHYARAVTELRPLVEELRELAALARISWHDGMGLVPNFALPEVAGIRFDI
jgi:uncharacterized coiled-coil DUF342 family protein